MKKTIVTRETNRTIELSELTEQKLAQVTGAVATNPLYTPLTSGGTNPLYEGATVVNNPLYTP